MCLAVPGRIVSRDGTAAIVDFGGVTREADLTLLPDSKVGDYVLVHAGFAIQELDEQEARETLALFDELARAMEGGEKGESP
jgi:hydrogenase expression/formation protein HypC